jgi:hypothetical protein
VEDDRPHERPPEEEFERFEDLARRLFKVPKIELTKKLEEHKIAPKPRD